MLSFSKKDGHDFSADTLWRDIVPKYQKYYNSLIVGVMVDNCEPRDLMMPVGEYENFYFIEQTTEKGNRIYSRSVLFLFITAVYELFPQLEVIARFTVNHGLYCSIEPATDFKPDMVEKIEKRMREIVEENREIVRRDLPKEEAIKLFKQHKFIAKANLTSGLEITTVPVYHCGELYDYLYGIMVDNTGVLGRFELDSFLDGVLLRVPKEDSDSEIPKQVDQAKFCQVLKETDEWAGILNCNYIPDLNRYIRQGKIGDIIRLSEILQETKFAEIAKEIKDNISQKRLILISGPSSSGKTSFAQRLKLHLRVNNIKAVSVSMDDYYRNREDTPKTPSGEYDYECLEALDIKLFNEHLQQLLRGESVCMPRYNFHTGMREEGTYEPLCLADDQPIIVEGIHGLNEAMTPLIPRAIKYKIYISALTPLNLDQHNRLHTTDTRLLRRLSRDYRYRSTSAEETLLRWKLVREGEEKYIFPFQEEADVIFNSAMIYEIAALKKYALPILQAVPETSPVYSTAQSMILGCYLFEDIEDEADIPNYSLIKEFIGGSCFFDDAGNLKE